LSEIKIEGLTKKYQNTLAIDNLSLLVKKGGFAVILGPSGCGKTTLLRCVAGLEKPDDGHIYIDGELVDDVAPRERDLSMVFQNYALFSHMTVYDNIAFPLKVRGKSEGEVQKSVKDTAGLLGIEGLMNKKPGQLSGGEQQRVAIARAVVRQPKAFLMDEPLSNLDAPLRAYLRTELKQIQKVLEITAIYVTHDQAEALALATDVGVMNHGRLMQYDKPESVYFNPSSVFVAGFVGNPPSNLLDVSLVEGGGTSRLEGSGVEYTLSDDLARAVKAKGRMNGLVLAIKPEHIRVSPSPRAPNSLAGEVFLVEPTGATTVLSVKVNGTILKSIIPAEYVANAGQRVWLDFNEGRVHVFDKTTGLLLV